MCALWIGLAAQGPCCTVRRADTAAEALHSGSIRFDSEPIGNRFRGMDPQAGRGGWSARPGSRLSVRSLPRTRRAGPWPSRRARCAGPSRGVLLALATGRDPAPVLQLRDGPGARLSRLDTADDRVGHRAGRERAAEVGGAAPGAENVADGALDQPGLGLEPERVAQQHRRRRGSCRAGWRCPCRRCRAPSRGSARTARGRPRRARPTAACPSSPASTEASSVRMSPNMFSVTTTSKLAGLVTRRIDGGVDEHVLERDVRDGLRRPRSRPAATAARTRARWPCPPR